MLWDGCSMIGKRMDGVGRGIGNVFKEGDCWSELDGRIKNLNKIISLRERWDNAKKRGLAAESTFCTVGSQRDLIKGGVLSHPCEKGHLGRNTRANWEMEECSSYLASYSSGNPWRLKKIPHCWRALAQNWEPLWPLLVNHLQAKAWNVAGMGEKCAKEGWG